LLQNMPLGRSKQITSCYNSTVHIRSLIMLMMLIYGIKPHTPYASSVHCKDTGLEVNAEKAENMLLFHEQHAAQKHNT